MSYRQINTADTRALLAAGEVTVIDIRDPYSYENGHIEKAIHIEALDVDRFVADEAKDKPLLIYCFHGIASQGAAEYFCEQGFTAVYSLDGGYVAWERDSVSS